MTNIDWRFSQAELKDELGLSRLIVVNDFAAIAWALPRLEPGDVHKVGGGMAQPRAAMAAIGPGSGTGVSALVPAGEGWAVVSGEGGHVTLAATSEEEQSVVEALRAEYGRCSLERVLSGPGLVNVYAALCRQAGRGEPTATPADVTALAHQGEPTARKAQSLFFAFLGAAAGDLAMTMGARGGVFIAGGIVPRLVEPLEKSQFRARFEAKGRYRPYVAAIPTYVITAALPAFRGLRSLLGYR
jgi:glucokinase